MGTALRSLRLPVVVLGAALALALAAPAGALGLDAAKSKGLLGEQADGYVGVVGSGSDEARSLAADVNAKRREEYGRIAKQRGISVKDVAALAGKKLVQRAPSGQHVRGTDGRWVQKP